MGGSFPQGPPFYVGMRLLAQRASRRFPARQSGHRSPARRLPGSLGWPPASGPGAPACRFRDRRTGPARRAVISGVARPVRRDWPLFPRSPLQLLTVLATELRYVGSSLQLLTVLAMSRSCGRRLADAERRSTCIYAARTSAVARIYCYGSASDLCRRAKAVKSWSEKVARALVMAKAVKS